MSDVGATVRLHAREGPASCSYCRGSCDDGTTVTCESCRAAYHDDCLAELGHCATLGCARPRASASPRPRIVIQPLRCCRGSNPSMGDVVVCDACAGRWHTACLPSHDGDPACCAGHGVTPDARVRPRDTGPRIGSERACTRCAARFVVEPATRYSPYCPPCRGTFNRWWLALLIVIGLIYLLAAALD